MGANDLRILQELSVKVCLVASAAAQSRHCCTQPQLPASGCASKQAELAARSRAAELCKVPPSSCWQLSSFPIPLLKAGCMCRLSAQHPSLRQQVWPGPATALRQVAPQAQPPALQPGQPAPLRARLHPLRASQPSAGPGRPACPRPTRMRRTGTTRTWSCPVTR